LCFKKARKKIFVQLYHRQKDCVFMYVLRLSRQALEWLSLNILAYSYFISRWLLRIFIHWKYINFIFTHSVQYAV